MRKLIYQTMVTLDGFVAGPNGELDWHNVDVEHNRYAAEFLSGVDTVLFGRVTYEVMAGFWPTEQAREMDSVTAQYMNSIDKVVVSSTLKQADWMNTSLIGDNVIPEIKRLKDRPGKPIGMIGSNCLAASLAEADLIDEMHLIVNPVAIGGGQPLLQGISARLPFKLLDVRTFASGNVLLRYA